MATRTTTTRTTSFVRAPSADYPGTEHADFSFAELVAAYQDCRRRKRNTVSALKFEQHAERNLRGLRDDLVDGTYTPGASICFVVTRPKAREVWAAAFRDRIVHHLLYNRIGPRFESRFTADSCACIEGRGTLYAVRRLESMVRAITGNWSRPAHYLKCDLANFFVSIDKAVLWALLMSYVDEPWWRWLTHSVLWHDPRAGALLQSDVRKMALVPPHKSLLNQTAGVGLPIGNLSSQFFANVYLNELDQFVKHRLGCRHYVRYVDDFVLLHESPQWLNAALCEIDAFLPTKLNAQLNRRKTVLQSVDRGIDFVGQVIKPWHRVLRRKTMVAGMDRLRTVDAAEVAQSASSYFGLCRQATHGHADAAAIANLVRRRGYSVDRALTKAYPRREKL